MGGDSLSLSNEKLERLFRLPLKLVLAAFFGAHSAFVVGYIAFTDIPFDGVVDFVFVADVASQLSVYWFFLIPVALLMAQFAMLEGDVSPSVVAARILSRPWFFSIIILGSFLSFFVHQGVSRNIAFLLFVIIFSVILFSPAPAPRPARGKVRRLLKMLHRSRRSYFWRIVMPRLHLYVRGLTPTLFIVFFVWLGLARFDHNLDVARYEILRGQEVVVGSIVGRNSRGLVIVVGDDYVIVPLSAILELRYLMEDETQRGRAVLEP